MYCLSRSGRAADVSFTNHLPCYYSKSSHSPVLEPCHFGCPVPTVKINKPTYSLHQRRPCVTLPSPCGTPSLSPLIFSICLFRFAHLRTTRINSKGDSTPKKKKNNSLQAPWPRQQVGFVPVPLSTTSTSIICPNSYYGRVDAGALVYELSPRLSIEYKR